MPYPEKLDATVTIAGTDVTTYVVPDTLTIESRIGEEEDTCQFRLRFEAGFVPTVWDEVVIQHGSTKIFGGYLVRFEYANSDSLEPDFEIQCVGYAARLKRIFVNKHYTNMTDAEILQAAFAEYFPEVDATTHVEAGASWDSLKVPHRSLFDLVAYLANSAGMLWHINYDKELVYRKTSTEAAPFGLSDVPDYVSTFPISDLNVTHDGSSLTNVVTVVGGSYLSNPTDVIVAGTGKSTRVILPFKMRGDNDDESGIAVYRNDGTENAPNWTRLTVKPAYINDASSLGANEVLYYYQERTLEAASAWPNLPNAVRVHGRYEVPVLVRALNSDSIAKYGKALEEVIVDTNITSIQTAKLRAYGELAQRALKKTAVKAVIKKPGLVAGQRIHIRNAAYGLDEEYVIHSVITTALPGGRINVDLSLGDYDPDLISLLLKLQRQTQDKAAWRDNEVLNQLVRMVGDMLTLNEEYRLTADSGSAYQWDQAGVQWGNVTWS